MKIEKSKLLCIFAVAAICILTFPQLAHSTPIASTVNHPQIYQKPDATTLLASFDKVVKQSKSEMTKPMEQNSGRKTQPLMAEDIPSFVAYGSSAYAGSSGSTSSYSNVNGITGSNDGDYMTATTSSDGDTVEVVVTMSSFVGGELWINTGWADSYAWNWSNYIYIWWSDYGNSWVSTPNSFVRADHAMDSGDDCWIPIMECPYPVQYVGLAIASLPEGYGIKNDVAIDSIGATVAYDNVAYVNIGCYDMYCNPVNAYVWVNTNAVGNGFVYNLPVPLGADNTVYVSYPGNDPYFSGYILSDVGFLDYFGQFAYNNPMTLDSNSPPSYITAVFSYS